MKQITEDYVSYEVAKLLKEKGFDEATNYHYNEDDERLYGEGDIWLSNSDMQSNEYKGCSAPSQSLALKWLREVHKIFIEINVSIDLNGDYHYSYSILDKECKYIKRFVGYYSNHESCVESALLYVLKNLI